VNSDKSTSPAQVGLASWLGGGSVFIVLLAVAAIAITCAILLNRLVQQQALVRTHPENGRKALFLNPVRMESIIGMDDADALKKAGGWGINKRGQRAAVTNAVL